MGIEVVVADLAEGLPDGELCGVLVQYPGASGRVLDPRAGDRGGPRAQRPRRRRRRPARADAARVARRARRRRRRRLLAALRRPAVLRRPARRLHGGVRRARAAPARPAGRCLRRRRGPPGVPAGPADPRAAHPPRQGDLQHLHRAGAARRRRLDVRRLPRSRGPARDRDAHPPATPPCSRRALRDGRHRGRARRVLRHPDRARCPAGPPRSSPRARGPRAAPAPRRRRPRRALAPPRRTTRVARSPRVLRAFGVAAGTDLDALDRAGRRQPARRAAPADRLPHPRGVHRAPQRDPDAALPAPALGPRLRARPRHDPARLVHDEAQRHHRDGAGQPARLRRPAPVRARGGRGRLPRAGRRPRGLAGRGHRLRPGLDAAERRLAGRARRPAGDPRLPPRQRRHRPRRLPDPVVGPRHQRRVRGDGRHEGRRGQGRRRRHRRPRRPARAVRAARRRPRRDHGDLPLDARRLRGHHHRPLRDRARPRRPGLRRRRQPQRAARLRASPASSAATCRTSTCTRRSASRTAVAARASDRSRCAPTSRRTFPRTRCTPSRGQARTASARSAPRRTARPASCRSRGPTSG